MEMRDVMEDKKKSMRKRKETGVYRRVRRSKRLTSTSTTISSQNVACTDIFLMLWQI